MSDINVTIESPTITLQVTPSDPIEVVMITGGLKGDQGDPGPGFAPGGTVGQVVRKASSTDFDTQWDTMDIADIPGLAQALLTPSPDYIQFNTDMVAPPHVEGRLYYDAVERTLNYYTDIVGTTVNLGQESLVKVLNKSGATIPDGTVVYLSGVQGQRATIEKAIATDGPQVHKTIGVTTSQILNNATGYVTVFGVVRGLNTSAFLDGDALWVSPSTAGELTNVRPVAPTHAVFVGYVLSSHVTQGMLLVNVEIGNNITELHDAVISNATSADTFQYDGQVWRNSQFQRYSISTRTGSGGPATTQMVRYTGAGGHTETLPEATGSGRVLILRNSSGYPWAVSRATDDVIDLGQPLTPVTTTNILPGQSLTLIDVATNLWEVL